VAKTGLDKWFGENWVDIGAKKKDGKATRNVAEKAHQKKVAGHTQSAFRQQKQPA
jgi:hypothetical protein